MVIPFGFRLNSQLSVSIFFSFPTFLVKLLTNLHKTPYLPLPFLNPTTYLASNLTSTNLISSPYLINFSFSFFLCQGFVIGPIGLFLTLHTKKKLHVNRGAGNICNLQSEGTRSLMTHSIFEEPRPPVQNLLN